MLVGILKSWKASASFVKKVVPLPKYFYQISFTYLRNINFDALGKYTTYFHTAI